MVFRPVISLVFHHFINLSCCHHHCYTTHWFSTALSGARGVNWGECWKRKGEHQGRGYGRNSFLVPQSRWTKGKKNRFNDLANQSAIPTSMGSAIVFLAPPTNFVLRGGAFDFWVRGRGGEIWSVQDSFCLADKQGRYVSRLKAVHDTELAAREIFSLLWLLQEFIFQTLPPLLPPPPP